MSTRDPRPERAAEEDERKAYLLRVPPSLLAELRRWADEELRSLNGHLEYVLREAVRRHRRDGPSK